MTKAPTYYPFIAFFILYFFFNNLFLPLGLLYTTLLVPLFLYWLYKRKQVAALLKWAVLFIIPVPFHLVTGIDPRSYFISSLLVLSALVFLFTALESVRVNRDNLEEYFSAALTVNSILVLIALAILPFPAIRTFMWDTVPMSRGLEAIPRLKLLAFEPSHYGLLLAPVFLFYILRVITGMTAHPLIRLAGVAVPLLLTFSLGIIGAMSISLVIGILVFFGKLTPNTRRVTLYGLAFIITAAAGIWAFWPGNPLYVRISNVLSGADSSSQGRLVYSFMFARDLIMQHDPLMGVGPGQIKILAHDLIINFYQYTGEYADTVRIPNSMGEMLATYGLYGVVLKIFIEVFFFFRLKIYRNLYSLVMFLFIFIYQFTGSFLVNAAEIGAWAIVFHSRFKEFESGHTNSEIA